MDPRTYYWNLLLVWPLEGGLRLLANDLHLGGALAIVLFTVLVRTGLLPLTLSQQRAQRKTAALKDELDALKRRYGKDAARLHEATSALYRERGVSPAAGLLPLLIQLPILFALYAALRDLGLHEPAFREPWLWLGGLHQPDTLHLAGYTLPGPLPVLAAGTQWIQQRLMGNAASPAAAPVEAGQPGAEGPAGQAAQRVRPGKAGKTGEAKARKAGKAGKTGRAGQNEQVGQAGQATAAGQPGWATLMGPAMMLWFGLSASAGLALYWITQNLIGVAQRRLLDGWTSQVAPVGGAR